MSDALHFVQNNPTGAAAEIERLREVVKYLRAILPPDRWADDARKMADAALGTTVQPVAVPSFQLCEHGHVVGPQNYCPRCTIRAGATK